MTPTGSESRSSRQERTTRSIAAATRPLGQGIRAERKALGWTLAELGVRVDLTPQAIGMVERGESDPSLSSLRRIADALGVPMFQFLLSEADRSLVVRREARVRIAMPDDNLDYELLSGNTNGTLELLMVKLYPGATTRDVPSDHLADECTVVISGTVTVDIAGTLTDLMQGDCVTIRAGLPHRFINSSDADAELVMAMSPATF
jgi:transcriptional regulator with XRE-family HTH domain